MAENPSGVLPALPAAWQAVTNTTAFPLCGERRGGDEQIGTVPRPPAAQAKALLQDEYGMSEEQAHRWLQKTAMDWRLPRQDVWAAVIDGSLRPGTTARAGGPVFPLAAGRLRAEITTGARPPGSRVTIADLHAAHGISRNCARKALRELISDGLLRRGPRRGYYVAGGHLVSLPRLDTGASGDCPPSAGDAVGT